MTSWYNSAMNYDMITAGPWNNMNLQMNQLFDHSIAWNSMFQVPRYDFNNFMPYGNNWGNSYLTNPFYTTAQMSWGTPMWNNSNWNMGGNPWSMWGGNWGSTQRGSGSSNNETAKNPEEERFRVKYNKLLSLCKQLVNFEDFDNDNKKSDLNFAINNPKSNATWKEKYEALEKAYSAIDKDTVKDFLIYGAQKVGVNSDINENEESSDSFQHRLEGIGYEYENGTIDDYVTKFYTEASTIRDNDAKCEEACEKLIGLVNNKTCNILDFISSWNSTYKGKDGSSRVMKHIGKYYSKLKDKDAQASVKSLLVQPLANELIDEAKRVKNSLNESSKDAIDEAIDKLSDAIVADKINLNTISEHFDKLYLITRRAATTKLINDAKSYYGDIDNKVFNDDLFIDDVLKDLRKEGFSDKQIKEAKVGTKGKKRRAEGASEGRESGSGERSSDINDSDTAIINIKKLEANGSIKELAGKHKVKVSVNGTVKDLELTLYEETKATGKKSDGTKYKKLYYINSDGKLAELTNSYFKDGKVETVDSTYAVKETVVQASEIDNPTERSSSSSSSSSSTDDEEFDAKEAGKEIATYLNIITDKDSEEAIASLLNTSKVTKDTIIPLLEGYYDNIDVNDSDDGILESLDDDTSNDNVDIGLKKNIIDCILSKAEEEGLSDTEDYKKLKKYYAKWQEKFPEATDFDQVYKPEYYILNCWFADCYNELMDKHIKNLYETIKSKASA